MNTTELENESRENLRRGLPAVIVAVIALGLTAYGTWVLPAKLPARYADYLAEYQDAYAQAAAREPDDASGERLVELAGSIDLCMARLDSFGTEQDLWARAEFYRQHMGRLESLLTELGSSGDDEADAGGATADAVDEDSPRAALLNQLRDFREKYSGLVERLSADDSPYARQALLLQAERAVAGRFDAEATGGLIERLDRMLQDEPNDPQLLQLMVQLQYEAAWAKAAETGDFPPTSDDLANVLESVDRLPATDAMAPLRVMLELERSPKKAIEIAEQWFSAAESASAAEASVEASVEASDSLEPAGLGGFVTAYATLGKWPELKRFLSGELSEATSTEQRQRIASQTAKSILRPFFSQLPAEQSAWCTDCWQGLDMAGELSPTSPELNALTWKLAMQHAERSSELADGLVEAIIIGQSNQRYLVLAISNAARGYPELANNYVGFAKQRDPQALSRVGNVILWRTNVGPTEPTLAEPLAEACVGWLVAEPNNPIARLALAKLELQLGRFEAAKQNLQAVEATLGKNATVDALLTVADRGLENESEPTTLGNP